MKGIVRVVSLFMAAALVLTAVGCGRSGAERSGDTQVSSVPEGVVNARISLEYCEG